MTMDEKVLRILDANANRAREGLRVVEEHLRLVRDNAELTARLKNLRHEVTDVIISMGLDENLIKARESETDVGAGSSADAETKRLGMEHIVTANLRRSQEALRVLEEYAKLVSREASARFKRLRFETYSLEREIILQD